MDTWEPPNAEMSSASIIESRWFMVKRPGVSISIGCSKSLRTGRLPELLVNGAQSDHGLRR